MKGRLSVVLKAAGAEAEVDIEVEVEQSYQTPAGGFACSAYVLVVLQQHAGEEMSCRELCVHLIPRIIEFVLCP